MGGLSSKPSAPAPQPQPEAKPVDTSAARQSAEETAAMRRARRRGGSGLLSETRLNAEQGVTTLGAGPQV